jgi:Uma2 family endonuclease
MSTAESTRLLTAEEFYDFCHLPENRDRNLELERGEVVEMSRPGEIHGYVCLNVGVILALYARQRKRGYACSNDTGVIWERDPDTVKGPDIVFYDQNRKLEEMEVKYPARAPKLAVEVRSPNDRWGKVQRRISQFLKWGTSVVWLVDPEERAVTVFRPNHLPQVLEEDEELTGGDELPDFRCKVAEFFAMPGA